jgi:2-desacetyl-2-hydroxyethyl bacteriochlorophyllide A dehydrogenase
MKAVVFKEVGKGVTVEDVPAPVVSGEHDVLIRVKDCGICGSDLAILEGRHPSKPPVILGHELSGEVVAVGKGVMSVSPDDHVVVDPNVSCGLCAPCRVGRRNMCLNMVELGITRNGGFAEFLVAPESFVYRVRDRLSWRSAALIEPLACVVHGFERSRVQPDETAVVYGAGPMGLLWVAMLRRAGVDNVFSVDLSAKRRDMAKQLGADVVIDPTKNDPVEMVQTLTDGRGADVAVEMIGRAETVENSVRSVGVGGRVVIMGVSRKEALSRVSPFDVMAKEVEIIGSNANAFGFVPAIRLVESGAISVDFIVSHEVPLSEAQTAFELCRSGEALKVLVRPT